MQVLKNSCNNNKEKGNPERPYTKNIALIPSFKDNEFDQKLHFFLLTNISTEL